MVQFSLNVNKAATLRNSRGKNTPDLLKIVGRALELGVHGITVHPRPDGRHIRDTDLKPISELVKARQNSSASHTPEFNIEGYPSEAFLKRVFELAPDQVTLVPDPPEALTSNAGWKFAKNRDLLKRVVSEIEGRSMRTSLFLDVFDFNEADLKALVEIKPSRVELYTETFADAFGGYKQAEVLSQFASCAQTLIQSGFGINAGHDLNQDNLGAFLKAVPGVLEVSIGHAVFCEALDAGLSTTLKNYLEIVRVK